MRRITDHVQQSWPTALGVALLGVAVATSLPVARWGDSAVVLLLLPAAVCAYLAGRRMRSLAAAILTVAAMLVALLPLSIILPGGSAGDWMAASLITILTVVGPWWIGRYRRLRAEQRESDARVLAERAQAEERARIADDLHDTIGHELALIAVQAGALELGRGLDEAQRERFAELREAAVRASSRLHDVVRMTRPASTGRLEPLGKDDIAALVNGAQQAGVPVEARLDSAVLDRLHPLMIELTARALREGLTNASRHAPGAAVQVELAADGAEHLDLKVRSGAPSRQGTQGSGHGIPSLQRRAALLGASVEAGAVADGFELRLRAPLRPEPRTDTNDRVWDAALTSNSQETRRRILQSAVVPAAVLGLAIVGILVVQAVTVTQTAIPSSVYEQIELGASRSELAPRLPAGIPAPPPIVVEEDAPPSGARCEYFAARDGWLHFTDAVYRLCFEDGVLVEKTLLGAS
ncbi:sensor histidine kinase [Microbacterium sp. KNMS]